MTYISGPKTTVVCEICSAEDYGSPCDKCSGAIMETCPHCWGLHAISEQAFCGEGEVCAEFGCGKPRAARVHQATGDLMGDAHFFRTATTL